MPRSRWWEVLIENNTAFGEQSDGVITVVAQKNDERCRTTKVFIVFKINIGATVDTELLGKFHLSQVQMVAGTQEALAEKGAQLAETWVSVCTVQRKQPHFHWND